ncbi:hypothetical protein V7S43_015085 [Phytophthora oleae]|uniref:Uncharacterized protein n=1 Tax=Phytophthora oleae TaxID=2107226 RepID=A0ABD3F1C2_9STRA
MTNLDKYNTFVTSGKRQVDSRRWKQIKQRKQLTVYAERRESAHTTSRSDITGSGLPMILCVGSVEGKLDDLMYEVMSEDLETMRIKASRSVPNAHRQVDGARHPFASTNLVKNRDYVYLEGTGYVTAKNGDRIGYHPLHSVSFPQMQPLPNRIRDNVSIIAFWRQASPKAMEMFATGIFDPCGDMIRMLVVPGMATAFLSSVKYAHCGQMKKLAFMLDKAYTESKQRGTPNRKNLCVTCSSPIGRRLGDFGKSDSSCKLCFGHVCHGYKAVRKLSFVDPDLLLAKRKVTFCSGCTKSVTSSSATDCARARMLSTTKGVNYASIESISTGSTYSSGVSFSS